jgi:hypothetical protein
MSYCSYYQAKIRKYDCWLFVASLRGFEHMAFDRTIDTHENIFEFYVPEATEPYFLELMHYYEQQGTVTGLQKLPNRLLTEPVIPE